MRFFTTMLVALLSILGSCNLKAQVTVSYADASTPIDEIATGYYVIKTKVRATEPYWLYIDNTAGVNNRVKFSSTLSTTDLTNVWRIEKKTDGSFYMMNVGKGVYIQSQLSCNAESNETGRDLKVTSDKNAAAYFSAREFTVESGTTKLDDNAFSISTDVPTATGIRQHLHVYGSSFTNGVPQYLSTWSNTIGTEAVNAQSTLVQFAFYKATLDYSAASNVPAMSENCLYYIQGTNGYYLSTMDNDGNSVYTNSQESACKFYIKMTDDGRYEFYTENGAKHITFSNYIWFMNPNTNDNNKVYFAINPTSTSGEFTINNYNAQSSPNKFQYLKNGTSGKIAIDANNADHWKFIPANDAATTARDLKLNIREGDNVHGNIATFSASYPVCLPENSKAYKATYESNVINITELEGNIIPANTGVLIKSDATGEVAMKPTLETGTEVTDNKLVSVGDADKTFTEEEKNSHKIYLFGKNNNGTLYFGLLNDDQSTEQTIGAHKAYIQLDSDVNAASLQINFGGEVTNINDATINDTNAKTIYYDLSGRRVTRPQHGLYIVNGKKVIIK